jgi:hypothetical protein
MILTFAKCTTIMIAELAVTSSLGSSFDKMVWFGMGLEWFWYGYGMVMAWYWIEMICGIPL